MKEKYFIDMRKTSGKNIGKSCCKKNFGSDVFRKIPDMENASGTNISSGCCSLQIPDEDGSGVFLLSAGVVDGGILVPVQIFLRVFFRQNGCFGQ